MGFFEILAAIYEGIGVTVKVASLGLLFAVPFAVITGVLQHFSTGASRWLITGIIEFWRSSPVLVLLYVFYYTLPSFGIYISAVTVGGMVLGLNYGGYASQSVRAALQSLNRGQREAALALGLSRFDVLRLVELPQAIIAMIPTFINQALQIIKGTTLVSLLALTDMTFRAKQISQLSYDPVGIYSALALSYVFICYPILLFGRHVERKLADRRAR